MHKVQLFTADKKYVTTVLIPPFQEMPAVIVWGARFFLKDKENDFNYYECFAVAAVLQAPQVVKKEKPLREAEIIGNDDLLFGLPNNLEEAVETYIGHYINAKDMDSVINFTEEKFISYTHHGSGHFIRNSWFLWWQEGHTYKEWPASKPALIKFFNDLGIYHADDMSSIIITSVYRKINKLPIELEKQVAHFKNYWKHNGFPDGIYKTKA